MPKAFENCVANGGRVITKSVNKDQYLHICYPKGGGPSVSGEVKTKKSNKVAKVKSKIKSMRT